MWELDHPVLHLDMAQSRWRTKYEQLLGWHIAEGDDVPGHRNGFAPALEHVDGGAV